MKISNYVLIASVAINALFLFSRCSGPTENRQMANNEAKADTTPPQAILPTYCDDSNRYNFNEEPGGGECITLDSAKTYVNNFKEKYKTTVKGVFFSKKAIDKIFGNDKNANGIMCYMAKTGKDDKDVTIVIEGTYQNTTLITDCPTGAQPIFRATVKCPDICSAVGNTSTSPTKP